MERNIGSDMYLYVISIHISLFVCLSPFAHAHVSVATAEPWKPFHILTGRTVNPSEWQRTCQKSPWIRLVLLVLGLKYVEIPDLAKSAVARCSRGRFPGIGLGSSFRAIQLRKPRPKHP